MCDVLDFVEMFTEYSTSAGGMSDMMRGRGMERGDERNGGMFSKPMGGGAGAPQGLATGLPANINLNDPSIKRALDGLMGARPGQPHAGGGGHPGYY